ncbi:hypothetical protein HGRIS_005128 [Hohenbuehelia grisea]|uniref:Uncharacterized protein n=1 Tax=Hohenbuehelia grisea TaxID=104357 RepID=A0ABR3JEX3_9AGAR
MEVLPEARRQKISTGPPSSSDLQYWAATHPFTQQIDVVFPASNELESVFRGLGIPQYVTGKAKLSDIVARAEEFISASELKSDFTILSTNTNCEDVWCIDTRGLLTLCVSKETYQALGLMGRRLPFKGCSEQYVISLPLQKHLLSVTNRAKRDSALQQWDLRRGRHWDVSLYQNNLVTLTVPSFITDTQIITSRPKIETMQNMRVPIPDLTPCPNRPANEEAKEDWHTEMDEIFEWVGMASLGSQRLYADDRVDPYIAVYEAPSPSRTASVTRVRWKGLLGSTFMQQVLDVAISMKAEPFKFVAISASSVPTTPVAYIPLSLVKPVDLSRMAQGQTGDQPNANAATALPPMRAPRTDSEDTWSVLIAPRTKGDGAAEEARRQADWVMVESIGRWDARWG